MIFKIGLAIGDAAKIEFKILYRFKIIDLKEYIGIVQSQQTLLGAF